MKQESKLVSGVDVRHAWKLPRMLSPVGAAARAFRYCRAAQQDEKNGFPFTAAMEWQKAADLFFPIAPFADLCWREWERIMRLPRHLAEPVIDQLQLEACALEHTVPPPAGNEPSFLVSA